MFVRSAGDTSQAVACIWILLSDNPLSCTVQVSVLQPIFKHLVRTWYWCLSIRSIRVVKLLTLCTDTFLSMSPHDMIIYVSSARLSVMAILGVVTFSVIDMFTVSIVRDVGIFYKCVYGTERAREQL